jgi:hypothetical protein
VLLIFGAVPRSGCSFRNAGWQYNESGEAMAEPLVLINAFEVPAAEAEKFIAAWEQSRDCAQEFLAATQSLGFRQAGAGLADYRPHPGLCRVVRT